MSLLLIHRLCLPYLCMELHYLSDNTTLARPGLSVSARSSPASFTSSDLIVPYGTPKDMSTAGPLHSSQTVASTASSLVGPTYCRRNSRETYWCDCLRTTLIRRHAAGVQLFLRSRSRHYKKAGGACRLLLLPPEEDWFIFCICGKKSLLWLVKEAVVKQTVAEGCKHHCV